jgi:hypothetical protein
MARLHPPPPGARRSPPTLAPPRSPLAGRLAAALLVGALAGGCAPEPRNGEGELPEPGEVPAAAEALAPWPDSIVREVLAMEEADERVRDRVASLIQSPTPDSAALARAAAEQQAVDRANTSRLKEIILEHGWPARSEVGPEVATAAFLIAQHAHHDIAFQKEYLAFVEREHAKGDAPGDAVALLTDQTRLAEGTPQLYGTQVTIQGGRLVLEPMEDEARVDERRAALGLGPLSEYLERLRQAYGLPR